MASKNDAANIKHLIATIRKTKDAALGSGVKDALVAMNHRRALFIMCSGMHTTDVQDLIKSVCEGNLRGPGLYVLSLLLMTCLLLVHLSSSSFFFPSPSLLLFQFPLSISL